MNTYINFELVENYTSDRHKFCPPNTALFLIVMVDTASCLTSSSRLSKLSKSWRTFQYTNLKPSPPLPTTPRPPPLRLRFRRFAGEFRRVSLTYRGVLQPAGQSTSYSNPVNLLTSIGTPSHSSLPPTVTTSTSSTSIFCSCPALDPLCD
jgi:hypothetical protein